MRSSRRALPTGAVLATALAAAALTGACSSHDSAANHGPAAARTIDVTMVDNAFQPAELQVKAGETVTLRFRNDGRNQHEALVGDEAAQLAHHDEMGTGTMPGPSGGMADDHGAVQDDHGDMSGGHADGTMAGGSSVVTVAPGATGELTWTFDRAGSLWIGCHEPGHWESGMKVTVAVS